jgi:hypothetical protein
MRVEDKKVVVLANVLAAGNMGNLVDCSRFSSWSKLRRVVAYVRRFVKNVKSNGMRSCGKISAEEVREAEELLIKFAQAGLQALPKYSVWKEQLGIFLDEAGVLRCAGRMLHSSLEAGRKYPILLPRSNEITYLIVRDAHERVLHSGVNDTMAFIRQRYWIPRLRQLTRSLVSKCVDRRQVVQSSASSSIAEF